jgi:hypothetical protein
MAQPTNHNISISFSILPYYYDSTRIKRQSIAIPSVSYLIERNHWGFESFFIFSAVYYQKSHKFGQPWQYPSPNSYQSRDHYLFGMNIHKRVYQSERFNINLLGGAMVKLQADDDIFVDKYAWSLEADYIHSYEGGQVGINFGGNVKFFMSKRFYASYTARHVSFFYTKYQKHILLSELGLGIKLGRHE